MDSRVLDILIGAAGFIILLALIIALPPLFTIYALPAPAGYLAGIVGFILFMSAAGIYVSRMTA